MNNSVKKILTVALSSLTIAGYCYADNSQLLATAPTGNISAGKKSMVVTNNPWSSQAANKILNQGGNATDAAIAAALVLSLTEPQSSGIGGGGYALSYYKGKTKAYDGREVAPASANPSWFLDENGKPLDFRTAWLSAKAAGVPGEIAMFYKMHQDSGKLSWKKLITPAIKLAKNGFPMSPILYKELNEEKDELAKDPAIKAVYFDKNGNIKAIGQTIKNPDFAKTLEQIAKDHNNFYKGDIAKNIVNSINQKAGTKLYTMKDLADYKALVKEPICNKYRDKYTICSVPPSTSGGVATQEILQLFANKYKESDVNNPAWVYTFLEASKLSYADRNQYLADPKFVKQPVDGLLDKEYLANRSQLIGESAMATPVIAGIPKGIDERYAPDVSPKPHGTTSLSIVDKDGNAVSMTVTVENVFGNHQFVNGFFLNNELTDFSFESVTTSGKPIANRVEAGKRPRSSIAPTIVFDENNKLHAVAGSPGGSFIICTVARNLILMLDLGQNPYQAAAYPNFCAINNNPIIESDNTTADSFAPYLQNKGEVIERKSIFSGEANILRMNDEWVGGADPRREGLAIGQ
ncbi:MAG: gamma-glutamyltransferase [Burkholderiales bacterium]|nr:gamma-glutamyltransferase [Burkholderiales bacterium]